jgi:hypothetical protein
MASSKQLENDGSEMERDQKLTNEHPNIDSSTAETVLDANEVNHQQLPGHGIAIANTHEASESVVIPDSEDDVENSINFKVPITPASKAIAHAIVASSPLSPPPPSSQSESPLAQLGLTPSKEHAAPRDSTPTKEPSPTGEFTPLPDEIAIPQEEPSRKRKRGNNNPAIFKEFDPPYEAASEQEKADWDGFCEIESDPSIFNLMLNDFGVRGVKVQEVFGLDQEMLMFLP